MKFNSKRLHFDTYGTVTYYMQGVHLSNENIFVLTVLRQSALRSVGVGSRDLNLKKSTRQSPADFDGGKVTCGEDACKQSVYNSKCSYTLNSNQILCLPWKIWCINAKNNSASARQWKFIVNSNF